MTNVRNPRRPTSPAYFLGRPAATWVIAQRRNGARPSRGDSDVARS